MNTCADDRYARQVALPEIGPDGQRRLAASRVLIVGAGGLGSPAAFYLAAAGIGTLILIDGDDVESSNLQRQILHSTADLGRPKVLSAAQTLCALNPEIDVQPVVMRLDHANGPGLVAGCDFVIDATDGVDSKLLIADLCHAAVVPYSHAGIARFVGQTLTVLPGRTACCHCVFGELTEPAAGPPQGPLGVVPGVIGAIQATEAIKFLLGIGTLLTDRLFLYDALRLTSRCVPIARRPDCPLCGTAPPPAPV